MIKTTLKGDLKDKYKDLSNIDASSVAEIISCYKVNYRDFGAEMARVPHAITIKTGTQMIEGASQCMNHQLKDGDEVILEPYMVLHKSGKTNLILGGLLVVAGTAALFAINPLVGAGVIAKGGIAQNVIASASLTLLFGGIGVLLRPVDDDELEDTQRSTLFNSTIDLEEPGHPIPLAFGKTVPCANIIVGFSAEVISETL